MINTISDQVWLIANEGLRPLFCDWCQKHDLNAENPMSLKFFHNEIAIAIKNV